MSQRRAEARRPQTAELIEDLAVGAPAGDPADAVGRGEVYAAIRELPEEFRDAIVAVDVVGLTYREAAKLLCPRATGWRLLG